VAVGGAPRMDGRRRRESITRRAHGSTRCGVCREGRRAGTSVASAMRGAAFGVELDEMGTMHSEPVISRAIDRRHGGSQVPATWRIMDRSGRRRLRARRVRRPIAGAKNAVRLTGVLPRRAMRDRIACSPKITGESLAKGGMCSNVRGERPRGCGDESVRRTGPPGDRR